MKRLFCLAAIAAAVVGHSFSAQAAGLEFGLGAPVIRRSPIDWG